MYLTQLLTPFMSRHHDLKYIDFEIRWFESDNTNKVRHFWCDLKVCTFNYLWLQFIDMKIEIVSAYRNLKETVENRYFKNILATIARGKLEEQNWKEN